MDSLTQMALGAAIGEATLGRRVGNRAALWGAVCGTLPDLDVFVPLGDAVRDFTYHRSASHSLLVLAVLTPLVVWLILRIHPGTRPFRRSWIALVYLVFATHVLLDSFTVYGTQIFWPLSEHPMTWSTIFIIDPAYTLPLLLGVVAALVMSRDKPLGHRLNWAGLVVSSAYLAWTVTAKLHVEDVARDSLAAQGIVYDRMLTVPSPFNSLVWRVLVVHEGGYRDGFYSVLDPQPHVSMTAFPSDAGLLEGIEDTWSVRRLQWFTKGFYAVDRVGDGVVITDLRMGLEASYVFRFKVGAIGNPHARPVTPERLPPVRDMSRIRNVWARIWDPEVDI